MSIVVSKPSGTTKVVEVGFDDGGSDDVVAGLQRLHLPRRGVDPFLVAIERAGTEPSFGRRRGAAIRIFRQDRLLRHHRAAQNRAGDGEAEFWRTRRVCVNAAIGVFEGYDDLVPIRGGLRGRHG